MGGEERKREKQTGMTDEREVNGERCKFGMKGRGRGEVKEG